MNRNEYVRILSSCLNDLEDDKADSILEYVDEQFEEAGPEGEQNVISMLGSPQKLAARFVEPKTSNQEHFTSTSKSSTQSDLPPLPDQKKKAKVRAGKDEEWKDFEEGFGRFAQSALSGLSEVGKTVMDGLSTAFDVISDQFSQSESEKGQPYTLPEGYFRMLDLQNSSGTISLKPGRALQVQMENIGGGNLPDLHWQVQNDALLLSVEKPKRAVFIDPGSVKMKVTVPPEVFAVSARLAAGDIKVKDLNLGRADMVVKTGGITIKNSSIAASHIHVSTGDIRFEGHIDESLYARVDMGDIRVETDVEPSRYSLDLSTKMGDVRCEGFRASGAMSQSISYNNPSSSRLIQAECGMGSIKVKEG